MKLFFFRGKAPNFGDELNTYLLPKIFPDFFDEDPSTMFLAIGSILNQEHPAKAQKIVFGSGYGGYGAPPVLDDTWKVYGVRGPRTAHALGLDKRHVAADTAVLINRHRRPDFPKTIRCSFMPHWESLERADWARVCQRAGINFIDPRWPVQTVLDHIEGSEKVIAEAMHGAIVSDALRVPWVPVMPFKQTHRFKWFDWAEALDIHLVTERLRPSSVAECWVLMTQREGQRVAHPGPLLAPVFSVINAVLTRVAAQRLKALSFATPSLSSDQSLERAIQRLQTHADEIKRDHRRVSV